MSALSSCSRLALSISLIAAGAIFLCGSANGEELSPAAVDGWSDAEVARHASTLAGPDTVAVVHFELPRATDAPCAAGWFDGFEKRLVGETLDEYGVREAVVAIDLGAFGARSTRAVIGMEPNYRDAPKAEEDLKALFAPLGESVTFHERTLRLSSDDSHVSAESAATLDAECVAKRLAAIGPAPLRIVTVTPRLAEDAQTFVSTPAVSATPASSEAYVALGFDYRTSTGTLRILRGERPAIELAIDDESGRAIALRGFARMARVATGRLFRAETVAPAGPGVEEIAEIELPPFGIPSAW